jgi:hypothetical protein
MKLLKLARGLPANTPTLHPQFWSGYRESLPPLSLREIDPGTDDRDENRQAGDPGNPAFFTCEPSFGSACIMVPGRPL